MCTKYLLCRRGRIVHELPYKYLRFSRILELLEVVSHRSILECYELRKLHRRAIFLGHRCDLIGGMLSVCTGTFLISRFEQLRDLYSGHVPERHGLFELHPVWRGLLLSDNGSYFVDHVQKL